VREATGIRTIAVGLITTPDEADRVIRSGDADLIAIARAVLWDPRWPRHAAAELGATIKAPPQYWRCEPRSTKRVFDGACFGQR
jgi:2,4-dienoyl-CoA reductase-like NADH-dependent reductase (Old Yellow Enzyme family)